MEYSLNGKGVMVPVEYNPMVMMMRMMMNCFAVWLTDEMRLVLFPAGTIVRNLRHRESWTRCEQDLNLCRT